MSTVPGRALSGLLGLALLAVLAPGLPTRLWPVLVVALAALGMSVAIDRWPSGTAFGLLVVALAVLQRDTDRLMLLAGAGVLLGLYYQSFGARAAEDWPSLRAWLIHQLPQAALLVLVVGMVPLGELLPVDGPVIAVAVGGLGVVMIQWWVRATLRSRS